LEFGTSLFPRGKHVEFNTYYEHDNNTGKHPNPQVNSAGLALYLFFFRGEKMGPMGAESASHGMSLLTITPVDRPPQYRHSLGFRSQPC
jgi:hypothetical protein